MKLIGRRPKPTQLRESLFNGAANDGGGVGRREATVDKALNEARSAPLSLQASFRRGAARVDSLLAGEGPQPVGYCISRVMYVWPLGA